VNMRILSFLVAVLVAVVARGHSADPMLSSYLWAQNQHVPYKWKSGQVPPSWMKPAIHAAATDNNESRASKAATFGYSDTGAATVGYAEPSGCGPNGIACMARSVSTDSWRVRFRKHGYVFDWGTLKWCQRYDAAPNGCFDVENIMLDELGHVQGLAHHVNYASNSDYTTALVQTISRTKGHTGWNKHAYGKCDVATLQKKYDLKSASTGVSTCLDLATKTTIARSAPGHSPSHITLTATLKTAANSAYGKLSGQSLANRTVKIQKQASGSTTWTTVATMVAMDGVYKYDVPSSSAKWRAVFTTPENEGVNGSTSTAIAASGY
jgi:hypothetical protein